MFNPALLDMARETLAREKRAFLPPGGPQDPAAAAGAAPPMDPAMAGAAPPMDPAMAGAAPPMDPAMAGAASMPAAPPADPAAAGAAPPPAAPAASPPPPGGDIRAQVLQALEEAGVRPKGAKTPKVDPAAQAADVSQMKKLIVNLHSALNIPLPYDIMDPPPAPADSAPAGGGGSDDKAKKADIARGAIAPIQPIRPAFDQVKAAADRAAALLAVRKAGRDAG